MWCIVPFMFFKFYWLSLLHNPLKVTHRLIPLSMHLYIAISICMDLLFLKYMQWLASVNLFKSFLIFIIPYEFNSFLLKWIYCVRNSRDPLDEPMIITHDSHKGLNLDYILWSSSINDCLDFIWVYWNAFLRFLLQTVNVNLFGTSTFGEVATHYYSWE